jgi:ribonuclease HI
MAERRENQIPAPQSISDHWTMYFDRSLKLGGGGEGVLFISPKGEQLKYVFQILFEVSNNEVEYEALLHGLRLAISLGIKRLLVYGDSLLVVQQVNKEWDINKETMGAYVAEIKKLKNKFSGLEIHHIIRDNNVAADVLSKLGSDQAEVPLGIFVHELHHPSINISTPMEVDSAHQETSQEAMMIEADWRTTFIDYIKDKVLPPGINKDDTEVVASCVAARITSLLMTNSTKEVQDPAFS